MRWDDLQHGREVPGADWDVGHLQRDEHVRHVRDSLGLLLMVGMVQLKGMLCVNHATQVLSCR